jgi:uncharacterized protein YxjI
MGTYLIARKWTRTDRSAIVDPGGQTQFEILGKFRRKSGLAIADAAGAQVATISRGGGFRTRYDITAGGAQATVHPSGAFKSGYAVDTTAGQLQSRSSNLTGSKYELRRGGTVAASVRHEGFLQERFTVEVADGEDAVLMLAAILAIERMREDRQRQSAAAASMAAGT